MNDDMPLRIMNSIAEKIMIAYFITYTALTGFQIYSKDINNNIKENDKEHPSTINAEDAKRIEETEKMFDEISKKKEIKEPPEIINLDSIVNKNTSKITLVSTKELEQITAESQLYQTQEAKALEQITTETKIVYRSPVDNEYNLITSPFGPRIHPISNIKSDHNGIDLAAPRVYTYAIADATVIEANKKDSIKGKNVTIQFKQGSDEIKVEYFHLGKLMVKKGQKVKEGDILGVTGNTGRTTGVHLHLGVKVNGDYIDPLAILDKSQFSYMTESTNIGGQ